jgi:hypothetical protein
MRFGFPTLIFGCGLSFLTIQYFISCVFVVDVNKIIHPVLPIYYVSFQNPNWGGKKIEQLDKFFVGGFRGRKERSFNKMGVGG